MPTVRAGATDRQITTAEYQSETTEAQRVGRPTWWEYETLGLQARSLATTLATKAGSGCDVSGRVSEWSGEIAFTFCSSDRARLKSIADYALSRRSGHVIERWLGHNQPSEVVVVFSSHQSAAAFEQAFPATAPPPISGLG